MTETSFSQANPAFAPSSGDRGRRSQTPADPEPEAVVEETVDESAPTLLKAGVDPVGDLMAEGLSQEDAIRQLADENGMELADEPESEADVEEEPVIDTGGLSEVIDDPEE